MVVSLGARGRGALICSLQSMVERFTQEAVDIPLIIPPLWDLTPLGRVGKIGETSARANKFSNSLIQFACGPCANDNVIPPLEISPLLSGRFPP